MDRPKLRNVDRISLQRGDDQLLVLRDPLAVADPLAVDAEFAAVLSLLDGNHTLGQIRQSLLMGPGLDVPLADLEDFVADLAAAGLLDDAGFRGRWAAIHREFVDARQRLPTLAGLLYPEDPVELRVALDAHLPTEATESSRTPWAVLVPHGPLALVAKVLGTTLASVPRAPTLDFLILLGADHHPGLLPYAVLDKAYRTPLGDAGPESGVIAALKRRLPWLDREAIRHRTAHSLEWLVLALQHHLGPAMPPIVPLLCGPAVVQARGLHDHVVDLVTALETVSDGAKVMVCCAAELSHAGLAYGRPDLDRSGIQAVTDRDLAMLRALERGRQHDLLAGAKELPEQGPPSGLPVLATLLEALPVGHRTRVRAYDLAPVPGDVPGWVGLGGVTVDLAHDE